MADDVLLCSALSNTVWLQPGDHVQDAIDKHPEGTKFLLESGIYKNVSFHPKNGQHFEGIGEVIFDGSIEISGWQETVSGNWVADGFPEPHKNHGFSEPFRQDMAKYREDLFIDNQPFLRVSSKLDLGPGKFYFEDGKVWISENPSGKTTFVSHDPYAVDGGNSKNVVLENLTFQHYASRAQHGAINAGQTSGWTLVNVDAINNHGAGVRIGDGMTILGGNYSHNGQIGIRGDEVSGVIIDGVTVAHNNYAGFDSAWDAGGVKILRSDGIIVRNSEFAFNNGRGLWFDNEVHNTLVEHNIFHHNEDAGYQYEKSKYGVLRENLFIANSQQGAEIGKMDSDIIINNSSSVEVYGNKVLTTNGHSIFAIYDRRSDNEVFKGDGSINYYLLQDITVRGNLFVAAQSELMEIGVAITAQQDLMSMDSIIWTENAYIVTDKDNLVFRWGYKSRLDGEYVQHWVPSSRLVDFQSLYASDFESSGTIVEVSAPIFLFESLAGLRMNDFALEYKDTHEWSGAEVAKDSNNQEVKTDLFSFADADVFLGRSGSDHLIGGLGEDRLFGADGDDTLEGGEGADRLDGGGGADEIDGGSGSDTLTYRNSSLGVVVNLATGLGSAGDAAGDTLTSIENIVGSLQGDEIIGDGADNWLSTLGGNDSVSGLGGNDTINGGDGMDTVSGGTGDDLLNGDADMDFVFGGLGADTLNGGGDTDALFGGDGADELYGEAGDDGLDGGLGNDTLDGGAGVDWLFGREDADVLRGGSETDALFGNEGNDSLQGDDGDDGLDGGAGNDTLEGGDGVDWLYGSFGDDVLYGATELVDSDDTDALFGQEGNDTLNGGGGGDNLDGGVGDDELNGGAGNDWLFGQGDNDVLNGGDGLDVLFGNDGNDTLDGGADGDALDGGAGLDVLRGGAGVDVLFGGADADDFVFGAPGEGEDLIRDFLTGEDRIVLDAAAFGIGTGNLAGQAVWQTGAGLPADFGTGGPVLYFDTVFNALFHDADGGTSGNATALFALETGTLTEGDIWGA